MATAQLTAPQTDIALAPGDLVAREIEGNDTNGEVSKRQVTPEEFMQLNGERAELVGGEVKETMSTMLSHDRLAFIIALKLELFVAQRRLGMVATGGSFRTGENQIRVPDVSFNSPRNLEGEDVESFIQKAPTLAVEVISKNDIYSDVDDKAAEFLRAGSHAVWIVNPRRRTVAVHAPDNTSVTYQVGDTIPGGEILPGFELPVADIFED